MWKVTALLVILVAVASAQIIPGQYVIQFRDNTPASIRDSHLANITAHKYWVESNDAIKERWEIGYFSGYSANIKSQEVLKFIASSPDVAIIENDQIVTKSACSKETYQKGLWGLNRITTKSILTGEGYQYNSVAGSGVDAYVIDTGILVSHVDFEGRAKQGISYVSGETTSIDLNGHGTHCAGTIGGKTYGIAKKATLIAVKVLGKTGSGTLNGIISGVNWVSQEAKKSKRPSTANLSLGAGSSTVLNNAIDALVNGGVFAAVAAGNDNQNACNYSPASASKSVCVGATDSSDILAYFSNWGNCTDILAPGKDILSAWIGSNTASNTISGTSMAAPHVAGVATLYLSLNQGASPTTVRNWMIGRANTAVISDRRGSPDRLLYQGCY